MQSQKNTGDGRVNILHARLNGMQRYDKTDSE